MFLLNVFRQLFVEDPDKDETVYQVRETIF